MAASILHFLQTVDEIEQNSWWALKVGPKLKPVNFTYSIDQNGVETITEVPKEPLESLLLRVRRLTMNDSPEQLHVIRKALKQQATHDLNKQLLDVWHSYWRLAFIKEPFEIDQSGNRELMTGYKVYDCFINGRYFHTNVPEYNVILYGAEAPAQTAKTFLFFQNMFHSVVVSLCLCAIALHRFIKNGNSFADMPLEGIASAFDFIWWRNRVDQLDEQYRVFNDWIEQHGGCNKCRWK
jgi:hypothetical protein